jgi:hypothetical protein
MTRSQLEHLIRAAADIAADDDIIIVGSQAILGQFPNAPSELRVSVEADGLSAPSSRARRSHRRQYR